MLLLKSILLAIFLVIFLQCNAFEHETKTNQKYSPQGSDESDKNDHLSDKLNRDKIILGDYHNRDSKKNSSVNSGDFYMPPVGAGELEYDDVTETSENYDETTSNYVNDLPQPLECILAQSQFYLSWWVHENGSLRVPGNVRLNTSGILDLSLYFTSEDAIYNHVLSFTSNNPGDVSVLFFLLSSIIIH
jgi:hypothetical protein